MSYLIPILIPSSMFFFQVTKTVNFKLPEEIKRNQSGIEDLREALKPVLDRNGIRSDLVIAETQNYAAFASEGMNLFTKSDAAILLPAGLYTTDAQACLFGLKHEISHIKNNDGLIISLLPAIYATASAIFSTLAMHWAPATLLTIAVWFFSSILIRQWREKKADDFAIRHSSDQELLGGRRYFIATQVVSSIYGTEKWDILHPSLTSRIEKIETAIDDRKITINRENEMQKINRLRAFIMNAMRGNFQPTT